MNPYRHLLTKLKALLATEAKMSEAERKANEWLVQVKFAGTRMVVGKGGVNTIFYQHGDEKRKVNYADWMCERLEALASQKHFRYELRFKEDGEAVVKNYWSLEFLKRKVTPERGMRVYGITGIGDEVQEELVLIVADGLEGMQWKPSKAKGK